jgi:hypothetical protein
MLSQETSILFLQTPVFLSYYCSYDPFIQFQRRSNMPVKDVLPEGEDLRRAVRWISGRLQESHHEPISVLVNEAVFKFDLSPKDADFLIAFYGGGKEEK